MQKSGAPVLVSPLFGGQGRKVGKDPCRCRTSGTFAPTLFLLVSLPDELADRLIGLGQRRLIGQKHDAEMAGASLLTEA
jgi:hypothetical protein